MATLKFNGNTYYIDHAVKGADYIHCYDENNVLKASFDNIKDFSAFSYSGTYMSPTECMEESCNDVKYVDGVLKNREGDVVGAEAFIRYSKYGSDDVTLTSGSPIEILSLHIQKNVFANVCFLRTAVKTTSAISAAQSFIKVPTACMPQTADKNFALSCYSSEGVYSALLNSSGNVRVIPPTGGSIKSGTTIHITGFWFIKEA